MEAYRAGCFPMVDGRDAAEAGRALRWYRPDRRGVLPLEPVVIGLDRGIRVPRRLAATIRRRPFLITTDTAFGRVVAACAEPRAETSSASEETWIDARIEGLFGLLHESGLAHSVEAWAERETGELVLVGGVYGLAVGRIFCAESMFCRPALGGTNASKIALVHLMRHCTRRGFMLIDTQMTNPHLEQFGVCEIPGEVYQRTLERFGAEEIPWLPFEPGVDAF